MSLITLIVIVLFIAFCFWATATYAKGIFRAFCFVVLVLACLYVLLTLLGVWGKIGSIHV